MAEHGSGNTAGELNVKFTGNAAPVNAAADEAKAALQGVATAAGTAGAELQSAGAEGAESINKAVEAMHSLHHAMRLVTKVIIPVAAITEFVELVRRAEEYINKANEVMAKGEESADEINSKLAERLRLARAVTDEQRRQVSEEIEGVHLRKWATDDLNKAIVALETWRANEAERARTLNADNFKGELDAIDAKVHELEQEKSRRLAVIAQIQEREAQAHQAEMIRQAEAAQKEQERADAAKAINTGTEAEYQAATLLAEARKAVNDQLRFELQLRAAIILQDAEADKTDEESIRYLRQADEERKQNAEWWAFKEQQALENARQRLEIERQITREKQEQQRGFGAENVPFFGVGAMAATINQQEISRKWSD